MTGQIKHIFATGNTAQGFYSLYDSVLSGFNRLFILQGAPGIGISAIVQFIGKALLEKGYQPEYVHNSVDEAELDGLLIPEWGIGIVDGSEPHNITAKYPGAVEEIINLGEYWDSVLLRQRREEIIRLTDQMKAHLEKAYQHFAAAKEIHFKREAVYVQGFSFAQANVVTEQLIDRLLHDRLLHGKSRSNLSDVRHMFLGATTANGFVNFIDQLTEDMETRIILKGRAGSGKSTLLKKLAAAAKEQGLDLEIYQCGFDPDSLDMVILPRLQTAVVDGTNPHPIEPTREADEIVDMYERCFTRNIDEEYREELADINSQYQSQIKPGVQNIAEANAVRNELAGIYAQAMDFGKVEQIKTNILQDILRSS